MMSMFFSLEENRVIAEALRRKRLCVGRLMSPAVLDKAVEGRNPDPDIVKGWFLCGDLNPEMYNQKSLLEMHHLGQNFRGPGGVTYLVLAQQCGHWQHRFVIQMLGQDAHDYLEFVRANPTWFSLADGDSERALLVKAPDVLKKVIPLDLPIVPVPTNALAVVEGAVWVAAQMLEPDAIREPGFPEVTDVCVSVVQMPSVVLAQGMVSSADSSGPAH